jgi:mono/diheme cytochrome c family protein
MPKTRFSSEQILAKLRQIEVQLAQGKSIALACKDAAISEQSYYRGRKEYGGLQIEQAGRLKDLERENARLPRRLVRMVHSMELIRHLDGVTAMVMALIFMAIVSGVAAADVKLDEARQGRRLVEAHCASCHAVGREGESAVRAAPPFRELATRYPAESLAEALAEDSATAMRTLPRSRPSMRAGSSRISVPWRADRECYQSTGTVPIAGAQESGRKSGR